MRIIKSLALACVLTGATSAWAGNIFLTGHDLDLHCTGGFQCNALGAGINFVRAGAPTPTLPKGGSRGWNA